MTTLPPAPTRSLAHVAPPLRASMADVHSQFGEDGIIEEIFRRLGVDVTTRQDLWCVEFGAWDGVHLSNTRKLVEDAGARAVLIEPTLARYAELVRNCVTFDGITPLHRAVGWRGDDRLDAILAGTPCPRELDLLSIDVDGHDYRIWEAVEDYRATIVVIEFNPTMPYGSMHVTPDDPEKRHGSSLAAIARLGERKGYRLVAVTEVNAILVAEERADDLGLSATSLETLTEGLTDFTTYLYQTHEGELRIGGNRWIMWHQVLFDEHVVQALPRVLRRHPEDLGPVGHRVLGFLRWWRQRRYDRAVARRH